MADESRLHCIPQPLAAPAREYQWRPEIEATSCFVRLDEGLWPVAGDGRLSVTRQVEAMLGKWELTDLLPRMRRVAQGEIDRCAPNVTEGPRQPLAAFHSIINRADAAPLGLFFFIALGDQSRCLCMCRVVPLRGPSGDGADENEGGDDQLLAELAASIGRPAGAGPLRRSSPDIEVQRLELHIAIRPPDRRAGDWAAVALLMAMLVAVLVNGGDLRERSAKPSVAALTSPACADCRPRAATPFAPSAADLSPADSASGTSLATSAPAISHPRLTPFAVRCVEPCPVADASAFQAPSALASPPTDLSAPLSCLEGLPIDTDVCATALPELSEAGCPGGDTALDAHGLFGVFDSTVDAAQGPSLAGFGVMAPPCSSSPDAPLFDGDPGLGGPGYGVTGGAAGASPGLGPDRASLFGAPSRLGSAWSFASAMCILATPVPCVPATGLFGRRYDEARSPEPAGQGLDAWPQAGQLRMQK